MGLIADVCFLGSGMGSGRAYEVGFCFVSCGGSFFPVVPSSALSSYFVRLSVISSLSLSLFSNLVFLRRVFSHVGQGGVG